MKILHVLRRTCLTEGGPVEGVRQISAVNVANGHIVEILSLDAPSSKFLAGMGVKVHAVGREGKSRTYGYSPDFIPWLQANAKNYDAIVLNGIWQFNAFGAWIALRGSNVPYFVYAHGMLDPWFKRAYPLKHVKKWLYWPWAVYPMLRDARAVLFTCDQERILARKSFWLYQCTEEVVRYGTPGRPAETASGAERFFAKHPILAGKRVFLFLGRIDRKKGPDMLLKSIGFLSRRGKWVPQEMAMVFVGPGSEGYSSELKGIATSEGISASVFWLGMLSGVDKWDALAAAEVFLLPSHQENFGIAVAEALSAAIPVLLGKGVNIWPDVVADNAGFAADDTVDGCIQLLERWLTLDVTQRSHMKKAARRCFETKFRIEDAAISLTRVIDKYASDRGYYDESKTQRV